MGDSTGGTSLRPPDSPTCKPPSPRTRAVHEAGEELRQAADGWPPVPEHEELVHVDEHHPVVHVAGLGQTGVVGKQLRRARGVLKVHKVGVVHKPGIDVGLQRRIHGRRGVVVPHVHLAHAQPAGVVRRGGGGRGLCTAAACRAMAQRRRARVHSGRGAFSSKRRQP